MRALAKYFINIVRGAVVSVLPLVILLLLHMPVGAQTNADSTEGNSDAPTGTTPAHRDSITSFEQFDMPMEVLERFMQLTPAGMLTYHDEFQVIKDGLYGQEIMVIKVWYIDDHMAGYIIETPMMKGEGKRVRKSKLDLPITWCCTPDSANHEEHCVKSLAEVKLDIATYKCKGWHIQLPESLFPEQEMQLPRPKKGKKGKKVGFQTGN